MLRFLKGVPVAVILLKDGPLDSSVTTVLREEGLHTRNVCIDNLEDACAWRTAFPDSHPRVDVYGYLTVRYLFLYRM